MTGEEDARLLRWLRRQVNRDLRRLRHTDPDQAIVLKAVLDLVKWAENWQRVREPGYSSKEVQAQMVDRLDLIMVAVRRVATGWKQHPGWREEWALK